ncbi:MAG: putative urea ABC transporter substrate-binding protein [Mariprofundales bacterium]
MQNIMKLFMMVIIIGVGSLLTLPSQAEAKKCYKIALSHYTGWEPHGYIKANGILQKHAKKHGVCIEYSDWLSYIPSIEAYVVGEFDGVVMTNMDAIAIAGMGGIDSTALIVGDYSNGNDGILTKQGKSCQDLKGRDIKLEQFSVSHYLLARCLQKQGLSERDVKVVQTKELDITPIFQTSRDPKETIVTWNPHLMTARQTPGANLIFTSKDTMGEIIDILWVRTDMPDNVKKALVGAWFEAMDIMQSGNHQGKEARAFMAEQAGASLPEFEAQLKTTAMFYTAADAVRFTESAKLKETMDNVRNFLFDVGLFEGANSADAVGIEYADGSIIGDKNNVKIRFDSRWMRMAIE